MAVFHFITYFGSRLLNAGWTHIDMTLPLDHMIPLCTPFIVAYFAAYAQWVLCFFIIARDGKELCFYISSSELIAKLCCLICFLAIPTCVTLPEVSGHTVFDWLTRFIYAADQPNNLFPSIHCVESWFCFRGVLLMKKRPKWLVSVTGIFSVIVFLSTVFVKQHVVVDIAAAIIVSELGLFLAKRLRLYRIWEAADRRLFPHRQEVTG